MLPKKIGRSERASSLINTEGRVVKKCKLWESIEAATGNKKINGC